MTKEEDEMLSIYHGLKWNTWAIFFGGGGGDNENRHWNRWIRFQQITKNSCFYNKAIIPTHKYK